jgi:CheY-like chemotaxis protein
MKDGPLPRSIRQVLSVVGNESSHVFVESVDEADLVIFISVRDVERGYSKEKFYACLSLSGQPKDRLPDNCTVIGAGNELAGLITIIGEVRKKLASVVDAASPAEGATPFLPDALRILVIDDTPQNIASAKSGLAGHRLTTVTGYEDAMKVLDSETFDVVLTDLHLPMSSKTMGDKFVLGQLVPYGILLMVEAARRGARKVAVVTDLSHHDDPFSAAFDHYSQFPVKIENAKVVMMHAAMFHGTKDWAAALAQLMRE